MEIRLQISRLFLICITLIALIYVERAKTTETSAVEKATSSSHMWITAYYTTWGVCGLPPQDIDYSAVTHIVHQSIEITSNPAYAGRWWKFPFTFKDDDTTSFEQGAGNGCPAAPIQQTLIDSAHAHGVRVLLGLGANEADYAAIASDNTKLVQYVNSVLAYAKGRGYDGVDVDWEFVRTATRAAFISLVTTLKNTLETWQPKGLLSVAVPGWFNPNNDVATMNARVDQVNLMTYDMSGYWEPVSGFNAPIHHPQINGYTGISADTEVNAWLSNGLDPSKTGFGVPFYGLRWNGVDGPGQGGFSSEAQVSYDWVMSKYSQSTYRWQSDAQVPYLSIPLDATDGQKYFISYEDSLSLTRKVQYAKTKGLGGVMVFELWRGLLHGKQPLMDAVRKAVWNDTTTQAALKSPSLNTPVDGMVGSPLSPLLAWTSSPGAIRYRVQVSATSDFALPVVDDTSIVTTSRQIGSLQASHRYYWHVQAISATGRSAFSPSYSFVTTTTTGVNDPVATKTPKEYKLLGNFPNPFNPSTVIQYELAEPSIVSLVIFNVLGQEVARLLDQQLQDGHQSITWTTAKNNSDMLATGMYTYRLIATSIASGRQFTDTQKMMFLK